MIPTRSRPDYLSVALASITPQARAVHGEVIVVDDGSEPANRRAAERHGARYVDLGAPRGLNSARNRGIAEAAGDLVVFVDDDVDAQAGWLDALLAAAYRYPDVEVFGGPIRPVFEGGAPRGCGRDGPPITSLYLGPFDVDTNVVWGANLAVRRRAFDRLGGFDTALDLVCCGDEEEWEARHCAAGGRVRYVAAAEVHHRRNRADSRLARLAAASYRRGSAARRWDEWRASAPSLVTEVRTLLGCVWHIGRHRCASGVFMAAHSAGRCRRAFLP